MQASLEELCDRMRVTSHHLYRVWDVFLIVTVTLAAVEIPGRFVLVLDSSMVPLDWAITVILLLDILARFRRPIRLQGKMVSAPEQIAAYYTRRWFWVDALAALPWHILTGVPLLQFMQLIKLARVAILLQQWRQSNMQHAQVLRLGTFVYWLLLTAHWLACGWLALGGIATETDTFSRYLRALYWCITTLATVGYGDITPSSNSQMVYAMVVMLLGVGVYGYVIGNVATLLANIDLAKTHYRENMERLAAFMRYRHLPPLLQQRIRNYYAYLWENRLGYDESAVLAELPDSLRTEVALFLRRDFIERAPLFQGASHELIRELALELRPAVFAPGDYIFRAGQFGRHMCFISRGSVEIISADGTTVVNTLSDGDFFGEIALLFSQPRTASVRAVDYCDLYTLDKDTFDSALARYPDFAGHIHQMARSRQEVR
jgi:hypothetical protein